MPEESDSALKGIDLRVYIGMLFFRWQIIVCCFLYCLLAGVIYIQVLPELFESRATLMHFREKDDLGGDMGSWGMRTHTWLLRTGRLRHRVVNRLIDEWGETMGGRGDMLLDVSARAGRQMRPTITVSVRCRNPAYGEAFLKCLIEEHEKEWRSMHMENADRATRDLEEELAVVEERIRSAQDDVIEYERLHDVLRTDLRAGGERAYIAALVGRRRSLTTQLMMLESQYPYLKDANAFVINEVDRLTRETGGVRAEEGDSSPTAPDKTVDHDWTTVLPKELTERSENLEMLDEGIGWTEQRVKLLRLRQRRDDLLKNLKPAHPQVVEVDKQISDAERELKLSSEVRMAKLKDRHQALLMQLKSVEAAEYKWQAKDMLVNQRRYELERLRATVARFETNYRTLYTRLQDMKIREELAADRFEVVASPHTSPRPVWPDPFRILLISVATGLGSGLGLAFVLQFFDNKVQSIKDVEDELDLDFLGGIPFWVHSGLERAIRPIVTEEHASGAVEAYRALRTTLLSALEKVNEKIVIVTSADSREGKTLTTLNLAIMFAQLQKKVLLIDMDIRKGRLHRSLGIDREPGVTDVLQDGVSLKEVISQSRIENLFVAPTGRTMDQTTELLQQFNLVKMFVDVQDDYDYIFVDTSPVLRVTDTMIIATQGIGVVLYVARVNHTPKPLIRYSIDMLRDAKLIGLIMNSIEMHKISSLYYTYQYPNYAYYSNAYAYGYDYYYYSDRRGGTRRRQSNVSRRLRQLVRWLRHTFLPLD
jgi:capsular exopolysaccharide synthesis family protein